MAAVAQPVKSLPEPFVERPSLCLQPSSMSSKRAPPLPQTTLDDLSDELLLRILCGLPPQQVSSLCLCLWGRLLQLGAVVAASLPPPRCFGDCLCHSSKSSPLAANPIPWISQLHTGSICPLPQKVIRCPPRSARAWRWCAGGGGGCARGRARCGRSCPSTSATCTTPHTCESGVNLVGDIQLPYWVAGGSRSPAARPHTILHGCCCQRL